MSAADVQVREETASRRKSGIGLMGVLRMGGTPQPGDRRELVFLVHGMGRTPLSMFLLGRRKWGSTVAIGVGFSAAVYGLFAYLLNVPLARGILPF